MTRSRCKILDNHYPYYMTSTTVEWLPLFIDPDVVQINLVRRGYIDEPEHWRYSSARDYAGKKGLVDVCNVW